MNINSCREYSWYLLSVSENWERFVQYELIRIGIEAFLPQKKIVSQTNNLDVVKFVPIFPSFIFVYTCEKTFSHIESIDHIEGFIVSDNNFAVIPERQVIAIKEFMDIEVDFEIRNIDCKVGDIAVVREGVLKDQLGKLIHDSNGDPSLVIELGQTDYSILIKEPYRIASRITL